jgi:hypothetical protein
MAKQQAPQVLIVADYFGNLHEVPYNNKPHYLNKNIRIKDKTKQYKIVKETTGSYVDASGHYVEGEGQKFIEQHNGKDPKYVAPKDMQNELSLKDSEIERLMKEVEALKNPTVEGAVKSVKAAQTPEEANQIASQYDEPKIEKAATEKIKELTKEEPKKGK